MNYVLNSEAIKQEFIESELVVLSTAVDCGPLQLVFTDQSGDELDSNIFAVEEQRDGLTKQFTVLK